MKNTNHSSDGASPYFLRYQCEGREVTRYLLPGPPSQLDISRVFNRKDLEAVLQYRMVEFLGKTGMSYRVIAEKSGLDVAQVAGRLKRMNVRLRDYRDGQSPLAKEVIRRCIDAAQKRLVSDLGRDVLKR